MSQGVDGVEDGGFDGWDYAEDYAYAGGEADGYQSVEKGDRHLAGSRLRNRQRGLARSQSPFLTDC